jgi:hypothetical protein
MSKFPPTLRPVYLFDFHVGVSIFVDSTAHCSLGT